MLKISRFIIKLIIIKNLLILIYLSNFFNLYNYIDLYIYLLTYLILYSILRSILSYLKCIKNLFISSKDILKIIVFN